MIHQMKYLMVQYILHAITTAPWDSSIAKPVPVLVHVFGDDGEEVRGRVEHVGDLDLVSCTLRITLATQLHSSVVTPAINVFCILADIAWALNGTAKLPTSIKQSFFHCSHCSLDFQVNIIYLVGHLAKVAIPGSCVF